MERYLETTSFLNQLTRGHLLMIFAQLFTILVFGKSCCPNFPIRSILDFPLDPKQIQPYNEGLIKISLGI